MKTVFLVCCELSADTPGFPWEVFTSLEKAKAYTKILQEAFHPLAVIYEVPSDATEAEALATRASINSKGAIQVEVVRRETIAKTGHQAYGDDDTLVWVFPYVSISAAKQDIRQLQDKAIAVGAWTIGGVDRHKMQQLIRQLTIKNQLPEPVAMVHKKRVWPPKKDYPNHDGSRAGNN